MYLTRFRDNGGYKNDVLCVTVAMVTTVASEPTPMARWFSMTEIEASLPCEILI